MTVTVVPTEAPFGVIPDPQNPPAPSPKTPLAQLKAQRAALRDNLHIDLKVPRWTPPLEIYVRYQPVDNARFESIIERRSKQGQGWSIWANADVLASSCLGVYAVIDGDTSKKFSLADPDEGDEWDEAGQAAQLAKPWTRFDRKLGETLGVEAFKLDANDASIICRELYLTDGDLLAAASKLMEWSGLSAEKLEEDFTTP